MKFACSCLAHQLLRNDLFETTLFAADVSGEVGEGVTHSVRCSEPSEHVYQMQDSPAPVVDDKVLVHQQVSKKRDVMYSRIEGQHHGRVLEVSHSERELKDVTDVLCDHCICPELLEQRRAEAMERVSDQSVQ
eukprot:CAMPEP_0194520510 /NCGR_PEP_ID=MMETSP0253-20130528/54520_1 /TAXON_ID=2966 /ORGANISM="Noctiluca scintillans" /LENGTH=132 /DNA_ID=CAMNT_0039364757 /DNA_START=91 /DNA_END=489 /DNA_ORIENTATION=-